MTDRLENAMVIGAQAEYDRLIHDPYEDAIQYSDWQEWFGGTCETCKSPLEFDDDEIYCTNDECGSGTVNAVRAYRDYLVDNFGDGG